MLKKFSFSSLIALTLERSVPDFIFLLFFFFFQFKNNSGTSKEDYFDNCTRDLETHRDWKQEV